MRVAERVDEIASDAARRLRDHMREQRIACNVERDAEKNIGRALVKLAGKTLHAGDIRNVKLEEAVAWRQRHSVEIGRVPRGNDKTTREGIALDHFDQPSDLIDRSAVPRRP